MTRRFDPRTLQHLVVAAVFLLALLAAASQVRAAPEAAFQTAFQLFSQASAGDSGSVDKAAEEFAVLLNAEPASLLTATK